jgi:anti-sigma regulatory factor (Ser/Thr protein kinase)
MDDLASRVATVGPPTRHRSQPTSISTAFTHLTAGQVCTLVRFECVTAGIAQRDTEDLLMAVSEIVVNAISYAGGGGSVTLHHVTDGLLVEIRDEGPGLPDSVAPEGHGLWLARLMCKEFDVVSSSRGVTVRMFTPRRPVTEVPNRMTTTSENEGATQC